MLTSYISNRLFKIKKQDTYSDLNETGVSQDSVLGPILYLLYISDILSMVQTVIARFADDTPLLTVGKNHNKSVQQLQKCYNN